MAALECPWLLMASLDYTWLPLNADYCQWLPLTANGWWFLALTADSCLWLQVFAKSFSKLMMAGLDWLWLLKAALDCWWLCFRCNGCPCLLMAVLYCRLCLLQCVAALDWVNKLQCSLFAISPIPSTTQLGGANCTFVLILPLCVWKCWWKQAVFLTYI